MTFATRTERSNQDLRTIRFDRHFTVHAEGSVLVCFGRTRVLCTASIEERVPPFLKGSGNGWLSAEYAMLPRATHTRSVRESTRGKQSGRSQEIQRLIGRSLRAVVDLTALGERQITLDCDVLQADGGTRTAAISGAAVAAHDAFSKMVQAGTLEQHPMRELVAAVSVGLLGDEARLDLDYNEDAACDTDLNVVMTASGGLIEIQGTAEGQPFQREQLNTMLDLAASGIQRLVHEQRLALQA